MKSLLLKFAAGLFMLTAVVSGFGQTDRRENGVKPPGKDEKPLVPPGSEPQDSLPKSKIEEPRQTTGDQTPTERNDLSDQATGDRINDAETTLRNSGLQSNAPRELPPLPPLNRIGTNGTVLALALADAVRIGLENNNEIEIARDEVRFAETSLKSLRGVYDPVFTVTPTLDYSVSPTSNLLGGSRSDPGRVRQTDFLVGSSVRQLLTRGGGSYSAFFNNLRRSTDSSLTALDPYNSTALGIAFTQPLGRNFRIDRARRDIRVQSRRIRQADADFRRRTIETVAEIQRAYWNLVFALRERKNRLNNIELVREQFRAVEGRIREGDSAPLERVQVEAELARQETELLGAARDVTFAENKLKLLILPSAGVAEWSAEIMPIDQPEVDFAPVDLDQTLKDARENRQELAQLATEREINEIDRRYLRDQTKPRVDLSVTLASTGLAGNPVSNTLLPDPNAALPDRYRGGYGRALGNLFNFETRNVIVGVTFEIPFRNRTASAQYAGAEIRREQLEASARSLEQTIEAEVRNAAQELETARQTVLQTREARRASEIQLAGEQQLFKNGNSTTFLVFERTNQLINARTLELRAETDFNTALANLQRATGTTLKAMKISLETKERKPDANAADNARAATSGIARGNYVLPPRETAPVSLEP